MICFYTDGSCSKNGSPDAVAGWSYCIVRGDILLGQDSGFIHNATNNIGELWGILKALTYIDTFFTQDAEAIIYSDSAYCVNGINEWRFNWKRNNWTRNGAELKNADLWKNIDYYLGRHKNVKVEKVKGHAGDKWNNMADKLAKEGVENGKAAI